MNFEIHQITFWYTYRLNEQDTFLKSSRLNKFLDQRSKISYYWSINVFTDMSSLCCDINTELRNILEDL